MKFSEVRVSCFGSAFTNKGCGPEAGTATETAMFVQCSL